MARDNNTIKINALKLVAPNKPIKYIKNCNFDVDGTIIHTRYKAKPSTGNKFPFNINENTLKADYELWVCGNSKDYYVIPKEIIAEMYFDPTSYPDHTHPDIRIVTIDLSTHAVVYRRAGGPLDLSSWFRGKISFS